MTGLRMLLRLQYTLKVEVKSEIQSVILFIDSRKIIHLEIHTWKKEAMYDENLRTQKVWENMYDV